MASIELKVMQSYKLCCDMMKNALVGAIQDAARKGEIQITHDTLHHLSDVVQKTIDEAVRNTSRQMQSACSGK